MTVPAASPPPPALWAAVKAAIARGVPVRLDFRWYPTLTSTMDVAADAAHAKAAEGLVVAAGEQTRGRGRRGRTWSSPRGAGLYLTFLFRPPAAPASMTMLPMVTLAAGVAVHSALQRATGFAPDLKWPNDLVVERRKVAGILCEGLGIGTPDQAVLVGIGLNVLSASHPGEIAMRATSLERELGRVVEVAPILEEMLVAVPRAYDDLRRGNADGILRSWRAVSPSARGATVEWRGADGVHRGTTAGIDDSGALLVTTARGTERVLAGELTWM